MKKDEKAIRCNNCSNKRDPCGSPIIISCIVTGRRYVANALRRCKHFNK